MSATFTLYRRELGATFNSPVAYVVVLLFLVISGALFWLNYFSQINALSLRSFFEQAPLFLAFFAPAMTMGSIAQEKDRGTLELLMTMPISDGQIVLAKFLSAVTLLGVVFAMTLAYPLTLASLAADFGAAFDWGATLAGYLGLMLLGSAYAAIGIMASSWTRDQVVAVLVAFSLCFVLYLLERIVGRPTGWAAYVLEYLSTSYHFKNIARGVLDVRDVTYYLSVIAVCLVAAQASLKAKR